MTDSTHPLLEGLKALSPRSLRVRLWAWSNYADPSQVVTYGMSGDAWETIGAERLDGAVRDAYPGVLVGTGFDFTTMQREYHFLPPLAPSAAEWHQLVGRVWSSDA